MTTGPVSSPNFTKVPSRSASRARSKTSNCSKSSKATGWPRYSGVRPAGQKQIARIVFGNPGPDSGQIGRGDHSRGHERAAQALELEAGVHMRGACGPDEHGVRGVRRPARQIGGAEIGRVQLGSGDLGDAVDTTAAGGGRVETSSSGKRLARRKSGFRRRCQRDRQSAMPLAVTNLTNSRREDRMLSPLGRCCYDGSVLVRVGAFTCRPADRDLAQGSYPQCPHAP